ncbi:hypothetical protein HK098_006500 [Nowakowskiella sp. JEL0407]|nr:hypothetical protein HK098_006500 [Nowakowskiella sp. JEL0407]
MAEKEWACNDCTFLNQSISLCCEICGRIKNNSTADSTIDLVSDSDSDVTTIDEELAAAIALSLGNPDVKNDTKSTLNSSTRSTSSSSINVSNMTSSTSVSNNSTSTGGDFLAQRKQMEQERLKRLEKNKHQDDETHSGEFQMSSKRARLNQSSGEKMRYLGGTVKLNIINGFSRDGYVSFDDIVKKEDLHMCILTAFQIDDEWLLQKLPRNKPICIVRHGKEEDKNLADKILKPLYGSKSEHVFPFLKSSSFYSGCMHCKIMVLKYTGFLRVVIGSANLVPYDWELIENIVYVQDFLPNGNVLQPTDSNTNETSQFKKDLCDLLIEMEVPKEFYKELDNYDFADVEVSLVASRPGQFKGQDAEKWGLCRLSNVIRGFGSASKDRNVECLSSSLGGLPTKFVWQMYRASCGEIPDAKPPSEYPAKLKILFPTENTVKNSTLGVDGGGVIFFSEDGWRKCPKDLFHNPESKRSRVLMHAKTILSEPSASSGNPADKKCWFYCGSHNFTKSAWGEMINNPKNDVSKRQITVNNWEVGVVMQLDRVTAALTPYKRPVNKYLESDKAWIGRES